jgi:hypothetical protein
MKYDLTVGMNDICLHKLTLYPNPARNIITIQTSETSKKRNLSIIDINEHEFISSQITGSCIQIDISKLPCGVYFVRVIGDKMLDMGKFIKQ